MSSHNAKLVVAFVSLVAVASTSACSAGPGPVAQPDAALVDASTAADSASPPDTGTDAGPPDDDGDGVPNGSDCSSTDATIGATADRACTGPCGDGMEHCESGAWGACDAPVDCLCSSEGATRAGSCGTMCERRLERCVSGRWTAEGACGGGGECVAGSSEVRTDPSCAEVEYACDDACHWVEGDQISPPGECAAGAKVCNPSFHMICTDDCHWVDLPGRC